MSKNGQIDLEVTEGENGELPIEFENVTHPEQWKKFPIALEPNENWSLLQILMGFDGAYMTQTWDTTKVVEAKAWRDAMPGRKLFIRKVLEQVTEVQESF